MISKINSQKNILETIFKTRNPIIGMIHFMPLIGYPEYLGSKAVLVKAFKDVKALERGGVDGIMVENNYDIPHRIFVSPETVSCMTLLAKSIIEKTKLPVGVNVLWNDYRAALAIAKITGAKFIRVPVFVDRVRTAYGKITGKPDKLLAYRQKIGAGEIAIFTDIQVKHAEVLDPKNITISAREAIQAGSGVLVVTGRWTAEAPSIEKLKQIRKTVGQFPVLIGSGATKKNLSFLFQYADGVIVGTSLKSGINRPKSEETNIRGFQEFIDERKVSEFVRVARKVLKSERR